MPMINVCPKIPTVVEGKSSLSDWLPTLPNCFLAHCDKWLPHSSKMRLSCWFELHCDPSLSWMFLGPLSVLCCDNLRQLLSSRFIPFSLFFVFGFSIRSMIHITAFNLMSVSNFLIFDIGMAPTVRSPQFQINAKFVTLKSPKKSTSEVAKAIAAEKWL